MAEKWEHQHALLRPGTHALIDEWRRKQPDIPDRNEAIRRLLAIALEGAPKGPRITKCPTEGE